MNKRIKLAGISIEIHTLFDSLTPDCAAYETNDTPAFTVTTTEQDIRDEQKKSMAECAYEGLLYPGFSAAELENTAIYRKIAQQLPLYDALVFHGSAVAVGERAFLFTAKSGTGKTTHTNLWLQNIEGSYVVNGDKPILRLRDGKVFVCGTPWMGKEGLGCNRNVELAGLCFLNRGEQNRIRRTELSAVLPQLIGQSYRPADGALLLRSIRVLEKIGQSVPLYELFCNMEDEAAQVAFKGMCV